LAMWPSVPFLSVGGSSGNSPFLFFSFPLAAQSRCGRRKDGTNYAASRAFWPLSFQDWEREGDNK
jgi:hypothetical protein